MARHLDLTALRSFTTVANSGGVTRAAAQLNLTQSAVSMQLKRLEELLGLPLHRPLAAHGHADRPGRAGHPRLRPAEMLDINDEAWGRMTNPAYEERDQHRRAPGHHVPPRSAGDASLRAGVSAGQGDGRRGAARGARRAARRVRAAGLWLRAAGGGGGVGRARHRHHHLPVAARSRRSPRPSFAASSGRTWLTSGPLAARHPVPGHEHLPRLRRAAAGCRRTQAPK